MRDGVAPSYLWLPEGQWPDMLSFLLERYPQISAAQWQDRMARGEVVDGDGAVLAPDSAYRRGMRIFTTASWSGKRRFPSTKRSCSRTNTWWWSTSRTSCR